MKKLLFLCVLLCLFCVILVSCQEADVTTAPVTTTEPLPNTVIETQDTTLPETTAPKSHMEDAEWYPLYQEYQKELAPDRSPLPSFEDLKKITLDMPFTEMYAIAGAAQRKIYKEIEGLPDETSFRPRLTYFVYDTQEGIQVKILLWPSYYVNENEYKNDVMGVTYIYPDGREEGLTRTNTQ